MHTRASTQHLLVHLPEVAVVGSKESAWDAMQVLRRYLLFSRALVAVPLAAVQGLKPHQLDDQAVAVLAAKSLSQQPWHRWGRTRGRACSRPRCCPR